MRKVRKKKFIYGDDASLEVASKTHVVKKEKFISTVAKSDVEKRFAMVHLLNERLLCNNGSWIPYELVEYYGKGISIEEVALRIRGYFAAFQASKDDLYLKRAKAGCDYLITERIYRDGHIYLQGHMTIDLPYAFAGEALLTLWKFDKTNEVYLETAKRIGDRLIEYQIAGSVNHAVVPVQFLGQLYQVTGSAKYLKNSLRRLMKTAVPMQLPYGGWLGHESWLWYHALILRSLIIGYVSLPNTLAYYAKRDKIACSILAAINRLINCQLEDGSFPIRPPKPICESTHDEIYRRQKATFQNGFVKADDETILYGSWNGYVIDALVTAYELLDVKEVVSCLNRYAKNIVSSNYVWRLEFDTLGAGRLLEYTHSSVPQKKDVELAMIS